MATLPCALTNDTHGSAEARQEGSKPKVTNLDLATCAVDEDVVRFEITVDDGWVVAMLQQRGTINGGATRFEMVNYRQRV